MLSISSRLMMENESAQIVLFWHDRAWRGAPCGTPYLYPMVAAKYDITVSRQRLGRGWKTGNAWERRWC
jgi:hypothetical protein